MIGDALDNLDEAAINIIYFKLLYEIVLVF